MKTNIHHRDSVVPPHKYIFLTSFLKVHLWKNFFQMFTSSRLSSKIVFSTYSIHFGLPEPRLHQRCYPSDGDNVGLSAASSSHCC